MTPAAAAPTDPAPASAPDPRRRALALLLLAVLAVFGAAGLGHLAQADRDAPAATALARDARLYYLPALDGELSPVAAWLRDPWAATQATVMRTWTGLNGQLDARLDGFATLALRLTALGALFVAIFRCASRRWFAFALAAAVIGTLLSAAFAPARDIWPPALPAVVVLLSLLHLLPITCAAPRSRRWWLGLGAAALNLALGGVGLASVLAATVWLARTRRTDPAARPTLRAHFALLGAGLILCALRPGSAAPFTGFALAAAPLGDTPWALVVWAPSLHCLLRWLLRPTASDAASPLPLFALATLSLVAGFGFAGLPLADAGDVILLSLALNAACLLPTATLSGPRLIVGTVWLALIANALIWPPSRPNTVNPDLLPPPAPSAPEIRAAVSPESAPLANRPPAPALPIASLTPVPPRPHPDLAGVTAARDPRLAARLPFSIRPPLPLRAADSSPTSTPAALFRADGAPPELIGLDGLAYLGTWSATTRAEAGTFTSQPLQTSHPLLQIRVAGILRPPATSLVLRTASGREIAPLDGAFDSRGRWKRINFPAPSEPFTIVARVTGPEAWLAFSAPVELGWWTWLFPKILRHWPWLFAAAVLAALVALWRAFQLERAAAPSPALWHTITFSRAAFWRGLPWVGIAAYLFVFSHYIDPTSGPNDSGGYLNNALILSQGQITGAPRLPAAAGIDTSPELYSPITFHAAGGRLVPEYPAGFPAVIALVAQVMPLRAAIACVILGQLALGIVFTWRLARAFGLGSGPAWLAGWIVGLSPVYLFQALQPQSDGPALVWVTAALGWAWTSRDRPSHALLAGLATALAVLIRPSNALCALPAALCFLGGAQRLRRAGLWALGGLPGALALAWYQHALYGSPLATGYSSTGGVTLAWHFVPLTLRAYATWLPELFSPVVILALAFPFLRSVAAHARLVLTAWIAIFVAFYAAYWCTWDNWYNMRFVLPALPAMLVAGLLVLRAALAHRALTAPAFARRRPWLVGTATAALLVFLCVRIHAREIGYWPRNNHEHAWVSRWLATHLPPHSVVVAKHITGSLFHYTDLVFIRADHDKVTQSTDLLQALQRAGFPVYALNYHWETRVPYDPAQRGSGHPYALGDWQPITTLWGGDAILWKLADPK